MDKKEAKRLCYIAEKGTFSFFVISVVLNFFSLFGETIQTFMIFFAILAWVTLSARKTESQEEVSESYTYLIAVDLIACLVFVFYIFFMLGRYCVRMF